MAGVLSFTLGLETSNFLRGLGLASGQIIGFSSAVDGLSRVMQGMWAAIERGGALTDLSSRTGVGVKSLFQLQEAFKQVGLGSENVAPMVLRLQRALSGVDEAGNKTDQVFKALGVNMDTLKGLDAPAQFEALGRAMGRLGKEDAADFSSRLFGREGAGNFLQIMRDYDGFKQSLGESGGVASAVARTAASFDKIGDTLGTIKMKVGGLFTGLAEGAAPAIQRVLDMLNAVDWLAIGQRIGQELTIAINAIDLGKFGEYFTLTLKAGVQEATNLLMKNLQESGLFGDKKPEPPTSSGWGRAWDVTKGVGAGLFGLWNEAGSLMGIPGAREMSDKRFDQAYNLFSGAGVNGGVLSSVAEAFTRGVEGLPNEFAEQLQKMRAELLAPTGATAAAAGVGKLGALDLSGMGKLPKTDLSEWEKVGFIFRGGGVGQDHALRTAENTRQMLEQQRKTNALLEKRGDGADFKNK